MAPSSAASSDLSPEYVFLGLLEQGACHGYELHERLQRDLGHIWRISMSQMYGILKRLEARKEIEGEWEPQETRPDRRRLKLSPAGKSRFESWLASPVGPSVRALRLGFVTKLYFAHRRGDAFVGTLIAAQEASLQAGVERLRSELQDIPSEEIFARLAVQMRITQLEASRRWLQVCRQALLGDPAM